MSHWWRGDLLATRAIAISPHFLSISEEGKCLGYWWRDDLLTTQAIDENMRKTRRAFFLFGSIGVFHGNLSPLSSVSILETCVVPILLYGSENVIMTES